MQHADRGQLVRHDWIRGRLPQAVQVAAAVQQEADELPGERRPRAAPEVLVHGRVQAGREEEVLEQPARPGPVHVRLLPAWLRSLFVHSLPDNGAFILQISAQMGGPGVG